MNTFPFHSVPGAPPPPQQTPPIPPPWFPLLPPQPPPSSAFWQNKKHVHDQLGELQDTLTFAKAMQKELEVLMFMKNNDGKVTGDACDEHADPYVYEFSKCLENRKIDLETQERLSVDAANSLMLRLRALLEPFRYVVDENSPWEEKSAVFRLSNKMMKSKRNKLWRKRKRKRIAEMYAKDHERFDQADREADEWLARETAKDIAQQKVEKMKEIAKLKEKEERKRLESELELVLIVEKLQELRAIRIQKLKKQGYFLPEEDDKFLEKVRAAVEEEERQAIAAADTDAAKDAIATAEESRKTIQNLGPVSNDSSADDGRTNENDDMTKESNHMEGVSTVADSSTEKGSESLGHGGAYDSVANLPIEFYHYYYGSNNDMGTLIEVRRAWDAYIRPGGSCIPGHWVQPPPPADDIWASYLVRRE